MAMFRTFTETYDLNTEQDCPTLLGIHTPIGKNPYHFLYPAFMMYRKYKYLGCDLTVVNAAHLPVDPSAFAIEGGTVNVDPRDTLNPILFKGCHGDSLGDIIDSMYGGLASDVFKLSSIDKEKLATTLSNFYYTALGDDAWRKSPVQKTLQIRGLHPIVYQLGTQMQVAPSNDIEDSNYWENGGVTTGTPTTGVNDQVEGSPRATISNTHRTFTVAGSSFFDPTTGSYTSGNPMSMFTTHTRPLGWMDTQQIAGNGTTVLPFDKAKIAMLPKIFMGVLMLPPANRAYQYLRVIIRHKFAFKEYRTITTGAGDPAWSVSVPWGYREEYTGTEAVNLSNYQKTMIEREDFDE